MSAAQIPNLPAVSALSGAELLECVQAGTSSKVSIAQIIAFGIEIDTGGFTAFMALWFASLPTTLPAVSGQPWNNGGILAFS